MLFSKPTCSAGGRIMTQTTLRSLDLRYVFVVLSMLICGAGVTAALRQQNDWQTVDVDGLFSFRLPPGWSKRSAFNVVEVRGEWVKDGTRLVYVWGRTESGLYNERRQSWMNDYEETMTRLGGRRANIRSFTKMIDGKRTYHAELNVGNWEKGEVQLYLHVESSDAGTVELANQIFKSVRLPLSSPERPHGR